MKVRAIGWSEVLAHVCRFIVRCLSDLMMLVRNRVVAALTQTSGIRSRFTPLTDIAQTANPGDRALCERRLASGQPAADASGHQAGLSSERRTACTRWA